MASRRYVEGHRTQSDAIDAGRETARRERGEVVIHDREGRIRDKDVFLTNTFSGWPG
jgi:hypothetical protein